MHIGIPITNRKPNMTYNEDAKFWVSNVDDYDYKIEYLKFEEGTPFPEEIHRNPHVAYKVDNLEKYIADAVSVICVSWATVGSATQPMNLSPLSIGAPLSENQLPLALR